MIDFEAAIEPLRASLVDLVATGERMRGEHGNVAFDGSEAMAELAEQSRYAGDWGQDQVRASHSFSLLLTAAMEDHLRGSCDLLGGQRASLYAHKTCARSALDVGGRAYYLLEEGIGSKRRLARWATERLFSAAEAKRLGVDPDRAQATQTLILESAEALGFRTVSRKGRPPALEEARLTSGEVVRALLLDDDSAIPGLGDLSWRYFSAVSHGTLYAVMQAIGPGTRSADGLLTAPLQVSAAEAIDELTMLTWAYVNLVGRVATFYGWPADECRRVTQNAVALTAQFRQMTRR